MDVTEALKAAYSAMLCEMAKNGIRSEAASIAAIVAFLDRVPEFGKATISANYAERPVNTPSRILAAIREAQS